MWTCLSLTWCNAHAFLLRIVEHRGWRWWLQWDQISRFGDWCILSTRLLFKLSILLGLPISRRCSKPAVKCLCPANIQLRLGNAKAYTATPRSSLLSIQLGTRNKLVGKNKKDRKAMCCMPESQQYEVPCAGRLPICWDLLPLLPPSHTPASATN